MTEWLSHWSYLGIFLCLFLDDLGIPLPEEVVLLAAGQAMFALAKLYQGPPTTAPGRDPVCSVRKLRAASTLGDTHRRANYHSSRYKNPTVPTTPGNLVLC